MKSEAGKSEAEYYDPDEDIRTSSPGLVPTQINYKPVETPPPYIPSSSSSARSRSSEIDDSRDDRKGPDGSVYLSVRKKPKRNHRRRKGRTRPSQGDAVLISYLDPNRPDIAREVAQRALNSASQSEAGDEVERDMSGGGEGEDQDGSTKKDRSESANATVLKSTAREAWAALNDVAMDDPSPEKPVVSASIAMHGAVNGVMKNHFVNGEIATQPESLNTPKDSTAPSRLLHPPLPLEVEAQPAESKTKIEDESIITSPALAKYAISAAEANPDSTLPAMQKSPPRPATTHSPDGTQSLPSLQTALSHFVDGSIVETPNGLSPFPPNPAQSPTIPRSQYISGIAGPSPSVYSPSPASSKDMTSMSPPGYPNHPNYWPRNTPKEGSFTTASPASVPGLTPSSSYTTPKELASPDISTPQMLIGPVSANGPLTSTPFKCNHPGCTALPFQTQYLLNSHANVHSSSRPHYCPVRTCPRSIGGKGFKRKNEMIRHGLVHDSPGYVCPFCADQQHRYPRPDNLQRHVRVHHPDKERDDPQLRSVLALRSGEGNRGRRRRAGA